MVRFSSSHWIQSAMFCWGILIGGASAFLPLSSHYSSTSTTKTLTISPSASSNTASILCHYHPNLRHVFVSITAVYSSPSNDNDDDDNIAADTASNVLGTALACCCANVGGSGIGTGFYRNGYCSTGEQDLGRHTVCVQVTDDFLRFSRQVGNDLSTPLPEYMFPGLQDGDIWCLCAQRWVQAYEAGMAPKLYLKATHEKTLTYVDFDVLRQYALDAEEAESDLEQLNEQREQLQKLFAKSSGDDKEDGEEQV